VTTTRGGHPNEDHAAKPDAGATAAAEPTDTGEGSTLPGALSRDGTPPPATGGGPNKLSVMTVSGVLALGLGIAAGTIPVPYVVESPGPAFNTLGDTQGAPVIGVTGHETYPAKGNLDLTTVYVDGGPNGPVSIFGAFAAWLDRSKAVYPEELIYPSGTTKEQADEEGAVAMTTSQENAVAAALTGLKIPFGQQLQAAGLSDGSPSEGKIQKGDVLQSINGKPITSLAVVQNELATGKGAAATVVVERAGQAVTESITPVANAAGRYILGVLLQYHFTFPFDVKISLDKVGGPSAGMMFSLGIIDTLTPGDLTGGKHVAGTGTISPEGAVGPIGGIGQKMRGARAAGATLFLAPAANCDEVAGNIPAGLQVVRVENLDQARHAVEVAGTGQDTSGLPGCSNN